MNKIFEILSKIGLGVIVFCIIIIGAESIKYVVSEHSEIIILTLLVCLALGSFYILGSLIYDEIW